MSSIWIKFLLPIIITVLFSLFIIPITLILIIFSRFLHRELGFLIHRYGRDNVVKIYYKVISKA